MMTLHIEWVKRSILTTGISIALGAAGVSAQTATAAANFGPSNPFYAPSTLPFQAPPFGKIKDSDYQPAIDAGMAQQIVEVESIANNPAPPTFENTIVALERSGQLLTRVWAAFNCVTGANIDDELQKVQEYEAPRLAAHQDAIYLNAKLFARVKAIYDQRASLHLDPESLRLVEYDYQQFVKAGANLSEADKAKLKKLNEEEATLANTFTNQLLAATKDGRVLDHGRKGARRVERCADCCRRPGRASAQTAGLADSAAEHHPAARSGISHRSRHAPDDL